MIFKRKRFETKQPFFYLENGERERMKKTHEINEVPIFKAGVWNGKEYTIDDINELVRNTNALIKSKLIDPVLKRGHKAEDKHAEDDGYPALGHITNIYRIGDTVYADIIQIPDKVYQLIEAGAYSNLSCEIWLEFIHPETNENIGMVLKAVSLLGDDVPAVKGLGDIIKLYNDSEIQYITFSEKTLKEEKMKIKKIKEWTKDEVKKYVPCCYAEVIKFMEAQKQETIKTDQLAEVLADIKYKSFQEASENPEFTPEVMAKNKEEFAKLTAEKFAEIKKHASTDLPPQDWWDKCIEVVGDKMPNPGDFCSYLWFQKSQDNVPAMESATSENSAEKIKDEDITKGLEAIKDMSKEKLDEVATFPDDKRPPKEWWDNCISSVSDKTDTPESLCGWIWANKSPAQKKENESEAGASQGQKQDQKQDQKPAQEPTQNNAEEELTELKAKIEELTELKAKIKEFETAKFKEELDKTIKANRGVFLPKYDENINKIVKFFDTQNTVMKFSENEPETDIKNVFLALLSDIAKSKAVIFEELAKTKNANGKDKEIDTEITEQDKTEYLKKFSGNTDNVENLDLAILAEKISTKKNVSYRDAVLEAAKILKEKK